MLVAFSFPEREYKKIFNVVSRILGENGIEYEVQWPHVSILSSDDISAQDKLKIQTKLTAKPTFKTLRWEILPGSFKDFLAIVLDIPEEYSDAYNYLREKYKIQPRNSIKPHVSILSFDSTVRDKVKELIPFIHEQTKAIVPDMVKSEYIQLWRMANPKKDKAPDVNLKLKDGKEKSIKDIEDKGFEIVDVMEEEWEIGSMTESKKKKKRKDRHWMLAPFYGKGDGRSGATMPPFRAPSMGSAAKLGPSLPGPGGINAPQYGTLPAGPAAPMVAWRKEVANLFEENEMINVGGGKKMTLDDFESANGLTVQGDLDLLFSELEQLPEDLHVRGDLDIRNSKIKTLPSGLVVNGSLSMSFTKIKDIPSDIRVKGNLYAYKTGVESLPKGVNIGGQVYGLKEEVKESKSYLPENFHACFVCNGNRVMRDNRPCPLCFESTSKQVSPLETCVDGGSVDNTENFMGFDIPFDLR